MWMPLRRMCRRLVGVRSGVVGVGQGGSIEGHMTYRWLSD